MLQALFRPAFLYVDCLFIGRDPYRREENLRQLAVRYLCHPDAQAGMVSMEAGDAGRFKIVIMLESDEVF